MVGLTDYPQLNIMQIKLNRMIQGYLVDAFVKQMNELNNFLRENMKISQAFYEKHANRHQAIPPSYQVGQKVFVYAKKFKNRRPCKKLDWKNLGPFTISKIVGSHSYQFVTV